MPASRIPFALRDLHSEVRDLCGQDEPSITITLDAEVYDVVARELAHHAGMADAPSESMIYSGIKLVRGRKTT